MRAAFCKGTRPGWQGLYNIAVRAVAKGKYSHCGLVFSDGISASATFLDGGVRFKQIDYNPAHWRYDPNILHSALTLVKL